MAEMHECFVPNENYSDFLSYIKEKRLKMIKQFQLNIQRRLILE